MKRLLLVALVGCSSQGTSNDPSNVEHDPQFQGWWIVDQPFHALYESTLYEFQPDGTLVTGASNPNDCSGHLAAHCVTGSVANCVPTNGVDHCEGAVSCVFGTEWHSLDSTHVSIAGTCSDGQARDIEIEMTADPQVLSVGGQTGWSHDNWAWSFRKCADSTTCT
jgi:hypothetical protein